MRILIISQLFPPGENPRAFRWGAVASAWQQAGHQVDVVCARMGGEPHGLAPGMNVYPVGLPPMRRYRSSPGRAGSGSGGRSLRSMLAPRARRVHDALWVPIRWPDYACVWMPFAIRRVRKLLAQNPYDAVVSVSNPFSSHVVAERALRPWPKQTWLCDIGDPFSPMDEEPPNNLRLYRERNRRAERDNLRRADVITVTTEGTRALYAKTFPECADKLRVIGPLLSLPDLEPRPYNPGSNRLVFAGMLFPSTRNPTPLLEVFRRLLDEPGLGQLELHFYGRPGSCRPAFEPFADLVGRRVFVHGQVPRAEVLVAMQDARALVNLGNSSPYQLPSKLVEYLHMRRPIVNFATAGEDSSATFLRGIPGAMSISFDELGENGAGVHRVAEFLRRPEIVSPDTVERLLAPHRIDAIAGAYERALRETGVARGEATSRTAFP